MTETSITPDGLCHPPQGSSAALITVGGMLVLAVLLVFAQTARHEFVNFDDDRYVYDNPHITGGINPSSLFYVMFYQHSHNWHPITGLTHLIDWQIYHGRAGGHHLTNVLLHSISVVLLMLLMRQLTGRFWPSVFTAALFAVHPLRVESVAWVAERKDVLSGMFFMLTLLAYVRYVRSGPDPAKFALVVVLFVCGLMSKPMLVTLPFLMLLLDVWPLKRLKGIRDWGLGISVEQGSDPYPLIPNPFMQKAEMHRLLPTAYRLLREAASLVLEKLPLLVLSVASCALTVYVQGDALQPMDRISLKSRFQNTLIAYADYLGVFFWPRRLAVMYPHPTTEIAVDDVKVAAICLVAVGVVALLLVRRWPVVLMGWLWYLGLLVPVIGIVQVGGQSMADRYTYLPQIGIAMALVWTADGLLRWIDRCTRDFGFGFKPLAAIAAACIVAALTVAAWRQTTFWRNSESLWTRDLSMYADRNAVANYNLGMTVADLGRHEEAVALYRKALEAIPDDQDSFINMGLSLAALGRYDEAVKAYRTAIKLNSSTWIAHKNLGLALKEQGKLAEAVAEWRKAIDLRMSQEKKEIPDLLASTAWILAATPDDKVRNPAEAIALARRAVEATNRLDATALDTLAIAYAASGRFEDALAADREALDLLQQSPASNAVQIAAIRDRMALFEHGKPYRDAK